MPFRPTASGPNPYIIRNSGVEKGALGPLWPTASGPKMKWSDFRCELCYVLMYLCMLKGPWIMGHVHICVHPWTGHICVHPWAVFIWAHVLWGFRFRCYVFAYVLMYVRTYAHRYIHTYIHRYITTQLTGSCPGDPISDPFFSFWRGSQKPRQK